MPVNVSVLPVEVSVKPVAVVISHTLPEVPFIVQSPVPMVIALVLELLELNFPAVTVWLLALKVPLLSVSVWPVQLKAPESCSVALTILILTAPVNILLLLVNVLVVLFLAWLSKVQA